MFVANVLLSSIINLNLTSAPCQWSKGSKEDRRILSLDGYTTEISVNGPDAKIVSCLTISEFPQHLVVEVFLGTSGTQARVKTTELYVLKKPSSLGEFSKAYSGEVGQSYESYRDGQSLKNETVVSYRFIERDGKLAIEWPSTGAVSVIE